MWHFSSTETMARKLEKEARRTLKKPLLVVCRTKDGRHKTMTIKECIESKAKYVHLAFDELDELLCDRLYDIYKKEK